MGDVVALPRRERERLPARPMPERLSRDERRALLAWAAARGYCMEEVVYAVHRVRDWARTKAREPLRRDWVRAIENALRDGWALRGFAEEQKRRGRTRRTKLTPEFIARHLEESE